MLDLMKKISTLSKLVVV